MLLKPRGLPVAFARMPLHAASLLAAMAFSPWAALAAAPCDLAAADARQAGPGCAQAWMDANLRINDIQILGTHNSYKQPMAPELLAAHRRRDPAGADSLDYGHRPLAEQLDRGVRGLELDIFYDPHGGRYTHASLPAEQRRAMREPGFKVMHLSDIDYRSSCQPFAECLRVVRAWSQAHPRHLPIVILINAKDGAAAPGAVQPMPFDAAAFDALDAEIRSVFPAGSLIEPRQVQGDRPCLREAVRGDGWPTLAHARGRVLFVLDESPAKVALYQRARADNGAMFLNAPKETDAGAAYLTLNDPLMEAARIAAAVVNGHLIRTRADADTVEARRNDTRRREAAFASGAQIVSTDYIEAERRFGDYRVRLENDAIARCNPRRTAGKCAGLTIEE
jgi:hypothetical protein